MNISKHLLLLYENKKKKKQTKGKEILDSNQELLINEAYLNITIPEQSTKTIFWHPFLYILFKNICIIMIFNMYATSEIVVRILTGLTHFSH